MPPELEEEEEHAFPGEVQAGPEAEAPGDEEGEDCEEGCACDEEDPFVDAPAAVAGGSEEESGDGGPKATEAEEPTSLKKKQKKAATLPLNSRLEALSKPKEKSAEPAVISPAAVIKKPEKKPQANRPSLLLRLRPQNLEEAWAAFEASGFQEAPKFKYSYSDEIVAKYFQENSNVCFELMPEAKRILQKVQEDYGTVEAFMAQLYGEQKIPAEEMRGIVAEYLKNLNIDDKVEIRLVDNMLSAANVVKNGEQYIVNIANGPISVNMVQGICDHEVGTHLLRMMNDEHQVWHNIRDRYKMGNPWTTEEGFATLNTYQSMPCRLMYPQALRYYAVCRGAQCGFVELFHELMSHTSEPKRCWQMCCRIKRGMIDTSLPGAFYLDQAYFKGAVEILRHLDEVDFGRLYSGQIALQDLDKVHFLLRKECVRLPKFLNSAETLKTYKAHCRRLIKENEIEAATEKVCKAVFIRTAKEFFKPAKQKVPMNATIAIGEQGVNGKDRSASVGASRTLDADRLADMARPRQVVLPDTIVVAPLVKLSEFDSARVAELSMPRQRAVSEAPVESRAASVMRALNLGRLDEMAKPRHLQTETETDGTEQKKDVVQRKALDEQRLLALAMPRKIDSAESGPAEADHPEKKVKRGGRHRSRPRRRTASLPGIDKHTLASLDTEESNLNASGTGALDSMLDGVPPPPLPFSETPRSVDEARLAELATPRKKCEEEKGVPCKCPPKAGGRRKRRSKLRILAMAQDCQQINDDNTVEVESVLEKVMTDSIVTTELVLDSLDKLTRAHEEDEPGALVPTAYEAPSTASTSSEQNALVDDGEFALGRIGGSELSLEITARPLEEKSELGESLLTPVSAEARCEQRGQVRPEPKARNRAVARARSFGPGENRKGHASGLAGDFGSFAAALGARSSLPYNELEFGGENIGARGAYGARTRPRVPVGLPRGAAAAVAAAVHGGAGAPGAAGSAWKAVPIKVMQFDFCGL